jgi:DNA-binding Xre family transcriptional regulator
MVYGSNITVINTTQPSLENLIEIAKCLKCEINDLVRMSAIADKQ